MIVLNFKFADLNRYIVSSSCRESYGNQFHDVKLLVSPTDGVLVLLVLVLVIEEHLSLSPRPS